MFVAALNVFVCLFPHEEALKLNVELICLLQL